MRAEGLDRCITLLHTDMELLSLIPDEDNARLRRNNFSLLVLSPDFSHLSLNTFSTRVCGKMTEKHSHVALTLPFHVSF